MSKYPSPITVPHQVHHARTARNKQIVRSAQIGIGIRVSVIILELVGVYFTQSSALFTDALSSLTDVISTLFLLFSMKLAQRPPDNDHPFGHGRYEPLGGLLLGILLMVLGGVMFVQQLFGVAQEEFQGIVHPLAWIFPAVAIFLLEVSYYLVMRTAKKEDSPALIADAVHYRVDSVTSFFAFIALLLAAYVPEWNILIDRMGALLIALFMIVLGIYAARKNFHQLMDKIPPKSFFERVKQAAIKVKGVEETEKIKIQYYGPDAHVDIDIEVNPHMSVESAHRISQQVRVEIQKDWPAVRDVTVHVEPFYANDH